MSRHVLDRPIWNALITRQTEFALGGDYARRFVRDIGPLASTRDDGAESMTELAGLVPAGGSLILLQADPIVVPPGGVILSTSLGVQMVADRITTPRSDLEGRIECLDREDWPEMHALATLTKPGPFESGTANLGNFWGIKENGKLLAMAGERMRVPGHTEVSGVCSHPDARGRGFARALSAFVSVQILGRGETPFLHAYSTNAAAIKLYESLGFRVRTKVNVAIVVDGAVC